MNIEATSARQSRLRANGVPHRLNGRPRVNGVLPARKRKRRREPDRFTLLPSFHSEPTREVRMQAGPERQADRLTVAYHSSDVEIELSGRGASLLTGAVESELVIDGGTPQRPCGDWQAVVWYSDGDCDYLELQLAVTNSVRIDRQLLLARRGHFAFIADAIVATQAARIEYQMRLPVAVGAAMRFDASTREGRLRTPGRAARVFPLGLPQDRVLGTSGSFVDRDGRLVLTQIAARTAACVPIMLDWHPRRQRLPAEWRSLTVSENCHIVGSDRAAGFRLRMGAFQLLVYRSLAPTEEARAVLGYHTRYETVIGMFDATGEVEPLVMVEVD